MKFQSFEKTLFAGKLHEVESRCTKIAATLQRIFSVTPATWAANKNSLFRNSSQSLLNVETIARQVTGNVA